MYKGISIALVWAIQKILVGVDGSGAAFEAATFAVDLAKKVGAEVTFLAVVDEENVNRLEKFGIVKRATAEASMEREMKNYTEEAAKIAKSKGIACDEVVKTGDVVQTIIDTAMQGGYQLLIIASRKRVSLERIASGEHTLRLVDFSPIPILIYKSSVT